MKKTLSAAFLSCLPAASAARADTVYEGMAKPWQMGFQTPATAVMERLYGIHDFLLITIALITLFVLLVMIYICLKFNRRANPVPSKTTHNTKLEIIWTAVPIVILIAIAIPSLRAHYFMQHVVNPELTVKVVGYQWYWHYDYPDQGNFGFDSYLKKGNDLKPGDHRMLSVDNQLVVPVDTTVRVLITGADVIHSWSIPSFGVKRDAVPGRLNESWFKADKIGVYYGQCSQLCGVGHGFMPIVVDVVSKADFAAFVAQKQKEAGIAPAAQTPAAGQNPTVPAMREQAAPIAKPESPAKTPQARIDEEKKRSHATGEGKPSDKSMSAPAPENHSTDTKDQQEESEQ